MQIEKIDNFETFKKIRENWDSVYAADHQAQFFLSWIWLSGGWQMVYELWFILAAKPDTKDSSYVAFFPLKNSLTHQDGGGVETEICMTGNSMTDYTGLICLPGYEAEVIPAFAAYLQQKLVWSSFNVKSILETDTRMSLFLNNFSADSFELSQLCIQSVNEEEPDIYLAPYVSLPDDWEQYLQNYLGVNTRAIAIALHLRSLRIHAIAIVFKSAKSVAFEAAVSLSTRRSKYPPIPSTTVLKLLPNPAVLITIQEREQAWVDRRSTPASTRPDTKSVKIENLRNSYNFKQICQIGNIPLISPDIFR